MLDFFARNCSQSERDIHCSAAKSKLQAAYSRFNAPATTVLRPVGRSTSSRENRTSFGTLSQLSMRVNDEDARREERSQPQEKERKPSDSDSE